MNRSTRSTTALALAIALAGCRHSPDIAPSSSSPPWTAAADDTSDESETALVVTRRLLDVSRLAQRPPASVRIARTTTGFDAVVEQGNARSTISLPLAPSVWSPNTWKPLATALLGPPPETTIPMGLVSYVLNGVSALSATSIEQQNVTVSGKLAAQPLFSGYHEYAAMLAVALALREGGEFLDAREPLALATAHLAIAGALAPQPPPTGAISEEGFIALTLLSALTGRQVDAQNALRQRNPFMDQAQSWYRIVELVASGDWRKFAAISPSTPAERFVRYATLRARAGATPAEKALDRWGRTKDPLWSRVVFAVLNAPVVDWRAYGENLTERELEEMAAVWALRHPGTPAPTTPAGFVDAPDAGFLVIGAPAWKRHFMRNVMSSALVEHDLYANVLHLPEEAVGADAANDERFGKLDDWPLVRAFRRTARPDPTAPKTAECAAVQPLLARLTPLRAVTLAMDCAIPWSRDAAELHFRGAAYDLDGRLIVKDLPPERRDELLAIAPYDVNVRLLRVLALAPPERTLDRQLGIYGPLVDYDVNALTKISAPGSSETREILDKRCALNADDCIALIDFLFERDRPDVTQTVERLWKEGRDRVAFAARAHLLLDAYFEQGRLEDAAKVASDAGATFSSRGLEAQALYFERMGNYSEAEAWYAKIDERYRLPYYLDAFHVRAAARKYAKGAYAAKGKTAEARLFGGPTQKVTTSELTPQLEGVELRAPLYPSLRHFGFQPKDTVLAIDGVRVKTWDQAEALINRTNAPTLTAFVIREGAVRELKGAYERRRFSR